MIVDFGTHLGDYHLDNGNVVREYQIDNTLIHIEFNNKCEILQFHRTVNAKLEKDYKNIPTVNQFAHKLFMKKYSQFELLINKLNSDQAYLMVYSLDYRMKNDHVECYCAINHDFDVPDNDKNYNGLWNTLEKENCTIRTKNGIILGGEID